MLRLLNRNRKAFHLLFTLRGLQHGSGSGGCLMLQREPSRCVCACGAGCVCADIFYTSQQSSLPWGVVLFYEWALMQEKSDLNTDRCEKGMDGWREGRRKAAEGAGGRLDCSYCTAAVLVTSRSAANQENPKSYDSFLLRLFTVKLHLLLFFTIIKGFTLN